MTLHIAYACNAYYTEQTMISIVSLLENNRKQQIVLYLVADRVQGRWMESLRKVVAAYGARLEVVSLDVLLGGLHGVLCQGNGRHPPTIYAKLFLDQICGADRILYLDSDTVVMGSILPLWKMDMGNALAAGVAMPYPSERKRQLGLRAGDAYVCDGVIMIHLKKWRELRCGKRCADYIYSRSGQPPMLSEGVVNYICRGHIIVLHPRYNLMSGMILWEASQIMRLYGVRDGYYSDGEIMDARNSPVIIHFLNELYLRPWFANSGHPYRWAYLFYRGKAGYKDHLPFGRLKARTCVLRAMNACLPFAVFCRLYRLMKGNTGDMRRKVIIGIPGK